MLNSLVIDAFKAKQLIIQHPKMTYLQFSTEKISFETPIELRPGTYDIHHIGAFSYMGGGSYTNIRHVGNIGRFCSIANNITAGQVEHPTDFISTSHVFHLISPSHIWPIVKEFHDQNRPELLQALHFNRKRMDHDKGRISIGNDVWIGEGVFISRGIKIGDGAIVAARSVVTKDVPPYAIVGGIPAKLIRYRFAEDVIERLCQLRWWAYGLNAMHGVNFEKMPDALDRIEQNIQAGAAVYAPQLTTINAKQELEQAPPHIQYITQQQRLDVYTRINGYLVCLDYNNPIDRHGYTVSTNGSWDLQTTLLQKLIHQHAVILNIGTNLCYSTAWQLSLGAQRIFSIDTDPHSSLFQLQDHRLTTASRLELDLFNSASVDVMLIQLSQQSAHLLPLIQQQILQSPPQVLCLQIDPHLLATIHPQLQSLFPLSVGITSHHHMLGLSTHPLTDQPNDSRYDAYVYLQNPMDF